MAYAGSDAELHFVHFYKMGGKIIFQYTAIYVDNNPSEPTARRENTTEEHMASVWPTFGAPNTA